MTDDAFRAQARLFADWIADYLRDVPGKRVQPDVQPGEIAAKLPAAAPLQGEAIETIFRDFQSLILPGMTHWQHPCFFGYFPANSSPPSVLAEMLTAALGAQCMSWQTSPAATELETRVMAWLCEMIGLPADFQGVIQDTASSATLAAVLTARERATDWRAAAAGLAGLPVMTVYCSAEAHSSVDKAVRIAGLGEQNLRKIPVDDDCSMSVAGLDQAIDRDLAAGRRPLCVVATLGTTGASGFDSLAEIGEICRQHDIWLHVDAAWAGSALILPAERWMIRGVELADSFVFNPHKWLFTNFDCSAYFVRDPAALTRTFGIQPEYLRTGRDAAVINYRDWGVPLGRRFRALKLWFVIRHYGVEGLQRAIADHIAIAREAAARVGAWDGFELLTPARLALFSFRMRPAGLAEDQLDRLNQQLLEAVNRTGAAFLTHTRVRGRYAIRFCVGQTSTTEAHVGRTLDLIRHMATAVE